EARTVLVDDLHFDRSDLRQRLALHRADERGLRRIAARRKRERPVTGIGLEEKARAALPILEAIRPRSHGPRANIAFRIFDDFARDRAERKQQADRRGTPACALALPRV